MMNTNHKARIERLEETARRWAIDNKVYESIWMENKTAHVNTWTQKEGLKSGKPIEFETVRAALDWVIVQMTEGIQAQIYVDDIRDIMTEDERAIFEILYFDAPKRNVMFDFRMGQDIFFEAMRLWKHNLSGVLYREWWEIVETRLEALLQSLDETAPKI